eukprot:gene41840-51076_t
MAWSTASYTQEVQRLTQLMSVYEAENVALKSTVEEAENAKQDFAERLHKMEAEKAAVTKKLRSVEITLKFEKAACDGMRRKAHGFEIELNEVKDRFKISQMELEMTKKYEADLRNSLNQERIVRLQLLHETEDTRRENDELKIRLAGFEKDNAESHRKLLDALQAMETLRETLARSERLVSLQSAEITQLNGEVLQLKEETQRLRRAAEEG